MNFLPLALLLLVSNTQRETPVDATIRPVHLRCENLSDPIGIGEPLPRLSWRLEATDPAGRNLTQTTYHVLVASTRERLERDEADLWDSGGVISSRSYGIAYAGRTLSSEMHCFWKVRVRDGAGNQSAWSAIAQWSMGLLDEEDWKAAWISDVGLTALGITRPHLRDAAWIGHPQDDRSNAPAERRYYRRRFSLSKDFDVQEATLLMLADNRCKVWLNGVYLGASDGDMGTRNRPVIARVEPYLHRDGVNVLAAEVENDGGPAGLIGRLLVRGKEGSFVLITDEQWECSREVRDGWKIESTSDDAWPHAVNQGTYGVAPWGRIPAGDLKLPPARYFRKSFDVPKPVRRAIVHSTALGIHELRLNGAQVGDTWFDPGWTDYTKRVHARSFDVTDRLHEGENALGAIVADGWYAGYVGYRPERHHYGEHPQVRVHLTIEFMDGTRAHVTTDDSWRSNTGPIVEADFLMGELYDARLERNGWDAPGFDDDDWRTVRVQERIEARTQPHPGPPVRVVGSFVPHAITEPEPGVYVFDMGQNIAGVCRLSVTGERGQAIQMRFTERLKPDGTFYTENLRSARALDTYVCRGDGTPETWEPRFTFHGFQYVELRGLRTKPTRDMLTALALSSDTPRCSTFECSDAMVNQLVSNIHWTQRANFIDVPTDCPQRDERLGWTGDAQTYIRTAAALCDVQAFFTKWLVDLDDAQRADGQFPMVAPLKVAGADGGPGWADAGVICPWAIYEVYGDRRQLERHYPAMVRFVEFCETRSGEDCLPPKQFHCFGDWVSIGADTPTDVIYTAYFAHAADLLARAATVLRRADDAQRFQELFGRIKQAFRTAYVKEDGTIKGDTQCVYVMALAFDLLDDPALVAEAGRRLVADIEARGGHLSTGFLGTKDLMLVLSKIGRDDIAYRLLQNETYPSWGFSIRHGATSIWERWNGWTPEKGFMDPGMNSFAHYSFGAVGQWIYETIGGIRPASPGYDTVLVRPRPGGNLTWAHAAYDGMHGVIDTHWKRDGDALTLDVVVPPNTTAEIHVPATESARVREASGLTSDTWRDGARVYRVGSGRYAFEVANGG